jgi:hypothetical protein
MEIARKYRSLGKIIALALLAVAIVVKLNGAGTSQPLANMAGQTLEESRRQAIATSIGIPVPPDTVSLQRSPRVVLHDTAWNMSTANIRDQQQNARGPMKLGPNVYIPRQPAAANENLLDPIARPFFDPHRPTSTFYEQAADILPAAERDRLARDLWRSTPEDLRAIALDVALTDVPTSTVPADELKRRSRSWLDASSEENFQNFRRSYPDNYFDGAKTTALWTARAICDRTPDNITCTRLQPVLEETRQRVAATINIEIVQLPGSHCLTRGKLQRLPGYTDYQYATTAKLYLYTALLTGRFPDITTHFFVDSFLLNQGKFPHCDPRGLDLQRLYDEIARLSGDPPGTLYGIVPNYGTDPRRGANIWWSDAVFGRSPPR